MKKTFILLVLLVFIFSGCFFLNKKDNDLTNYDKDILYLVNAIKNSEIILIGEVSNKYISDSGLYKNIKHMDKVISIIFKIIKFLYLKKPIKYNFLVPKDPAWINYDYSKKYLRVFYNFDKNKYEQEKDNLVSYKRGDKYFVFIDTDKNAYYYFYELYNVYDKKCIKMSKNAHRYTAYSDYGPFVRKIQIYSKRKEKLIMELIKEIKGDNESLKKVIEKHAEK